MANHPTQAIAPAYGTPLRPGGVDTVPEPAPRNPAALAARLVGADDAKSLVRRTPAGARVAGGIEHTRTLPRLITH